MKNYQFLSVLFLICSCANSKPISYSQWKESAEVKTIVFEKLEPVKQLPIVQKSETTSAHQARQQLNKRQRIIARASWYGGEVNIDYWKRYGQELGATMIFYLDERVLAKSSEFEAIIKKYEILFYAS